MGEAKGEIVFDHVNFAYEDGKAVLDDGRVIEVRDFLGFAEKVMNKW